MTLFRFPRGVIAASPAIDAKGRLLLNAPSGLLTLPPDYAFNTPFIVGFANAASYVLSDALYPGEILSIFGFDLAAPPQNVQVLSAGKPATVLFAGPNQINVQVPFEFWQYANPPQIEVVLPLGDVSVNPIQFGQSLGIFTTDGVYAAALNQDGSMNSEANPATRGSITRFSVLARSGQLDFRMAQLQLRRRPWTRGKTGFRLSNPTRHR